MVFLENGTKTFMSTQMKQKPQGLGFRPTNSVLT